MVATMGAVFGDMPLSLENRKIMPTNLPDKIDIQNRLQDKDRAVRYQALRDAALYFQSGVTLDTQLFESVISILRDEDREIVYEAAEVLVRASETQGSADLVFKTLTNLLSSSRDTQSRRVVTEHLMFFGEQAIPILIETLNDQDEEVRGAAIVGLIAYDSKEILAPITSAFHRENNLEVKTLMLDGVAHSSDTCWLPLLTTALHDQALRYATLAAISSNYNLEDSFSDLTKKQHSQNFLQRSFNHLPQVFGGRQKIRAPNLFEILTSILPNDPDPAIREQAASCFSYCYHGRDALTLALNDPHDDVREKAAYFLGTIGDIQSIDPLHALFQHEQTQKVRVSILAALGSIRDERILPILTSAMDDSDAGIRGEAVSSLGSSRNMQAIPALCRALTDSEINIRQEAAHGLGSLASFWNEDVSETLRESAANSLCNTLSDSEEDVRSESAAALGDIQCKNAIPALLLLLHDVSDNVRMEAMKALSVMKAPECLAYLLEALNKNDFDAQKAAAANLLHYSNQVILDDLLAYLKKPEECTFAKGDILSIVGQTGDISTEPVLISFLQSEDEDLREKAAHGLAHIHTQAGIEALIVGLNDEDSEVRKACIRSLAMIGDERAIAPLIDLLNDSRAGVRRRVLLAVASFKYYDAASILEKFLKDPDENVRQTASDILEELENGTERDFYRWGSAHYE